MIKKAFLLGCSLALFACAPSSPKETGPESLSFEIDVLEDRLEEDSLIQMRFHIEDLKINSSCASCKSLEKDIRQQLLSNNQSAEESYRSYDELFLKMKKEFRRLKQESEMKQVWEMNQSLSVVLNQQGLFGLQSAHSSFTGGAHDNTYFACQTYRLADGELLSLDSLLQPEKKADFIRFCESTFRQKLEISASESLEEHGFWFTKNRFHLPDNFSLSAQGLSLIYNRYEIAPYTFGVIELKLKPREIMSFLKSDYLIVEEAVTSPELSLAANN